MNTRTGLLTISRIALLAGLSTLAVGCGGGGKAAPLMEADYCTQRAVAECTTVADTCGVLHPDCQAARNDLCVKETAAIKAADPQRVFHPENVPACVSKATQVYKLPLIKPSDLAALDDVCNYVYHGDAAKMAACGTKYDCLDATVICDKGFCYPPTVTAANGQCLNFGAVCGASQYCMTSVSPPPASVSMSVCTNKLTVGKACSATAPCADGFYCTGGTCQPQLGMNAPCCADSDCSTAYPYCNPYAGFECGTGLGFATHSPSCAPFGDTMAQAATGQPTCAAATPDAGAGDAQ
jgi:hypothetical protein